MVSILRDDIDDDHDDKGYLNSLCGFTLEKPWCSQRQALEDTRSPISLGLMLLDCTCNGTVAAKSSQN